MFFIIAIDLFLSFGAKRVLSKSLIYVSIHINKIPTLFFLIHDSVSHFELNLPFTHSNPSRKQSNSTQISLFKR